MPSESAPDFVPVASETPDFVPVVPDFVPVEGSDSKARQEYLKALPRPRIVQEAFEAKKRGDDLTPYREAYYTRAAEGNIADKDLTGETPDVGFLKRGWEGAGRFVEGGLRLFDNLTQAIGGQGLVSGVKVTDINQAKRLIDESTLAAELGTKQALFEIWQGANSLSNKLFRKGQTSPWDREAYDLQFQDDLGALEHFEQLATGTGAAVQQPARQYTGPLGRLLAKDEPEKTTRLSEGPVDRESVEVMSEFADLSNYIPVGAGAKAGLQAAKLGKTAATVLEAAEKAAPGVVATGFSRAAKKTADVLRRAERVAEESPLVGALGAGVAAEALGANSETAILAALLGANTRPLGVAKQTLGRAAGAAEAFSDVALGKLPAGPLSKFAVSAYRAAKPAGRDFLGAQLANTPFLLGAQSEDELKDQLAVNAVLYAGGAATAYGGSKVVSAFNIPQNYFAPGSRMPESRAEVKDYGIDQTLDLAHRRTVEDINNAGANLIGAVRKYLGNRGEVYVLKPDDFNVAVDGLALTGTLTPETAAVAKQQQGIFEANVPDGKGGTRRLILSKMSPETPGLSLGHEPGHLLFRALLSPEEQAAALRFTEKAYGKEGVEEYRRKYEDLVNGTLPDDQRVRVSYDVALEEIFAEHVGAVLNSVPIGKFGFDFKGGLKDYSRVVYGFLGRALEKLGVRQPKATGGAGVQTGTGIEPSVQLATIAENYLQAKKLDADVVGPAIPGAIPLPPETPAPAAPATGPLQNVRPVEKKPVPAVAKGDPLGDLRDAGGMLIGEDAIVSKVLPNDRVEVTFVDPDTGQRMTGEMAVADLPVSKVTPTVTTVSKGPQSPITSETPPGAGPMPGERTQRPATAADIVAPKAVENVARPEAETPRAPKVRAEGLDMFGNASEEVQRATRAQVQQIVSRPRNEIGAYEIDYNAAVTDVRDPDNARRQLQRDAADAAEAAARAEGRPNPLRARFLKVIVPFQLQGRQVLAWSPDKIATNLDLLRGWFEQNPAAKQAERATYAYLTSPQIEADLLAGLQNLSNGYAIEGRRLQRPADTRPGSITPENPNYTPVQIPRERAEVINLLQGLEQQETTTPALAYALRFARQNGLVPTPTGETADANALRARLRNTYGFDAGKMGLLESAVERLNIERILAPLRPRTDLPWRAGDTGIVQAAFMPAPRVGTEFKDFFSRVTKGTFGKSARPFTPELQMGSDEQLQAIQVKNNHSGNFDDHIAKSIPTFYEAQIGTIQALSKLPEGSSVLDIAASEGSWGKAISELSGGRVATVSLDPNPDMATFFRTKSDVPGASYVEEAFLNGFTDDTGVEVPAFNPANRFDAVHESMGFQFIDPDRSAQIAEVKRLLKPDGIFVTEEKLLNPGWAANEKLKDTEHKNKFFTAKELEDKQKVVGFAQSKSEQKAVGMLDNMSSQADFERVLRNNFAHVVQYWDSGNFMGYVAGDNRAKVDAFLKNLPDLNSRFSTVRTPRDVSAPAYMPAPKVSLGKEKVEGGVSFGRPVKVGGKLVGNVVDNLAEGGFNAENLAGETVGTADTPKAAAKLLANAKAERPAKAPAVALAGAATSPTGMTPTGWVLPNGEYAGMSAENNPNFANTGDFHSNWLQNNGKRWGLESGDRLAALNKGFVRTRLDGRTGRMGIEANRRFVKGPVLQRILDVVEANSDRIGNLDINLFNDKGEVVGQESLPYFRMDEATRYDEVRDALRGARKPLYMPAPPVESPEFKRWFGDSKVVDADGLPLVVFHGTLSDFTRFNKKRANPESNFGQAFYFSNDLRDVERNYSQEAGPDITLKIETIAEQLVNTPVGDDESRAYSRTEAVQEAKKRLKLQHGGATLPVYLSLQNPAVFGGPSETYLDGGHGRTRIQGTFGRFLEGLRKEVLKYSNEETAGEAVQQVLEEFPEAEGRVGEVVKVAREVDAIAYLEDGETGALVSSEVVRGALQRAGFDGVIDYTVSDKFQDMGLNEDSVHYIAFKPTQIKSAIGNVGTFDPTNPDIRYMPDTGNPEMERVAAPAIRLPNGRIVTGDPHSLRGHTGMMTDLFAEGVLDPDDPDPKERYGFVSTSGRFLERAEAFALARKAGQVAKRRTPTRGLHTDSGIAYMPATPQGFYSQLEETLSRVPPKASRSQIEAALRDGVKEKGQLVARPVKAEEMRDVRDSAGTSFEQFLKDNPNATRQEMLDFVSENKVQTEEKVLGGTVVPEAFIEGPNELGEFEVVADDRREIGTAKTREQAERIRQRYIREATVKTPTRFELYVLPGGENYGETVFTLPGGIVADAYLDGAGPNGEMVWRVNGEPVSPVFPGTRAAHEWKNRQPKTYTSSHFPGVPNYLAHARHNERTTPAGEKVFHIEEVQSDLHQEGRKKGYQTDRRNVTPLTDQELQRRFFLVEKAIRSEAGLPPQEQAELESLNLRDQADVNSGVPDAPFKKSWHELVFKRMLRKAAELDSDFVAWTTGEQQAERYDLSKKVDAVFAQPHEDGTFSLHATEPGSSGMFSIKERVPVADLSEVVGKDLAEKIAARKNKGNAKVFGRVYDKYSGLDLKVGGEGMKGFYDSILPEFANKYLKRFGVRTETVVVETPTGRTFSIFREGTDPTSQAAREDMSVAGPYVSREAAARDAGPGDVILQEGGAEKVHAVRLTPELKAEVLEKGQPMYMPVASPQQESAFKDSKVRGADGKLLPLVHATDKSFDKFGVGDLGYHFGTAEQAVSRLANTGRLSLTWQVDPQTGESKLARSRAAEGARSIPVFLNITRPLQMLDAGAWDNPNDVFGDLPPRIKNRPEVRAAVDEFNWVVDEYDQPLVGPDDFAKQLAAQREAAEPALAVIRDAIKAEGYDGIVYNNAFEGSTYRLSYIAFDNAQIMPAMSRDASARFMPAPALSDGDKAWLDPKGGLVKVSEHEDFAQEKFGLDNEQDLMANSEKLMSQGWVRVAVDGDQIYVNAGPVGQPTKLTKAQRTTLEDQSFNGFTVFDANTEGSRFSRPLFTKPGEPQYMPDVPQDEKRLDAGALANESVGMTPKPATLQDFTKPNIQGILDRSDWVILTAHNRDAKRQTPEQNATQNAALEAELQEMGVEYVPTVGKYGNTEDSFYITGLPTAEAQRLIRKYGQESGLMNRGLLYQDGSIQPATGITVHDKRPDDYYTELPDGGFFTADIDFNAPRIPAPEPQGLAGETVEPAAGALAMSKAGERDRSTSTAPLMSGEEKLEVKSSGKKPTVLEVGRALAARARRIARIPFDSRTKSALKAYATALHDELKYAVEQEGSAIGWYEAKIEEAMNTLAELHPEIKDRVTGGFYRALLAITSNGQDVTDNFRRAEYLYSKYKETGRLETDSAWGGKTGPSINKSLAVLQGLIDRNGMEKTVAFLDQPFTVAELRKAATEVGLDGSDLGGDEAVDFQSYGSLIFGPKIGGGFYQNLRGNFTPITMDLWVARTWNRINGSYGVPNRALAAEHIANIRELASQNPGNPDSAAVSNMSDRQIANWAEKRLAAWTRRRFKDGDIFDRPAKAVTLALEGKIGGPRNGGERAFIRKAFAEIDALRASEGLPPINNADKQAALWFYEKNLYAKFGVQSEAQAPSDYAIAARKVVDSLR